MLQLLRASRASAQWAQRRAFAAATTQRYPVGSNMHDNEPSTIDKEHAKMLKGESKSPVDHAPGWNQDLASDSEAIVKGDQSSKKNPKQLQSETVQHIEGKHKETASGTVIEATTKVKEKVKETVKRVVE